MICFILFIAGIAMLIIAGCLVAKKQEKCLLCDTDNEKCAGCQDPNGGTICDSCTEMILRIRCCQHCKLSVSGETCPMCGEETLGGDHAI